MPAQLAAPARKAGGFVLSWLFILLGAGSRGSRASKGLCYPPLSRQDLRQAAAASVIPPASGNARAPACGQKPTPAELWLPTGLAPQRWPAWGWGGCPSVLRLPGSLPAQRRRLAPCAGWGQVCPPLSAPPNNTSPLQLKPEALCSLGRFGDGFCVPLERDWVWKSGSAVEGAGKRTFF